MSAQLPGLEIIRLWPSVVLERDLADPAISTRALIALAGERPADGVFAIDHTAVEWLKDHVADAVGAYLRETGFAGVPRWGARARFEVLNAGDYRPLANQPDADLAGMYVLQWPSQGESPGGRDDALPGCISFYDPRIAMNMNAIRGDPYHDYHKHLVARAGLLALWPAYLSYFVHPNRSREPVMRVVFDVHLHAPARST